MNPLPASVDLPERGPSKICQLLRIAVTAAQQIYLGVVWQLVQRDLSSIWCDCIGQTTVLDDELVPNLDQPARRD
ncbi:hypothetical protein JOE52_006894 [Bradyrhizobium canariense]|nr:hypothetical protein [Bradyrhizobium canariense]